MGIESRFQPFRQVTNFRRLSDSGFITDLSFKKRTRGVYTWKFRFEEIKFSFDGTELDIDFTKYLIKVVYTKSVPPKVFVLEPDLPRTTKHLYMDKSLCIYKPSNWQWQNEMKFDEDLFPNICTWLYFYEKWVETGNWYGEEAVHDLAPNVVANIMNRNRRMTG